MTSTMYRQSGDKEKDELNLALCRAFGWEWIRESKPRPSSNPMKFPLTVGTEAGGMGRCQSDIVVEVIRGCKNVLKKRGMLEGEPIVPPKAMTYEPYHLYAENGEMFISNVRAGDLVKEG
jgi:predicted deacylase